MNDGGRGSGARVAVPYAMPARSQMRRKLPLTTWPAPSGRPSRVVKTSPESTHRVPAKRRSLILAGAMCAERLHDDVGHRERAPKSLCLRLDEL